MYQAKVQTIGKVASVIMPQLNIDGKEKLIAAAKQEFSYVIYDMSANTQFYYQNPVFEKGEWIIGGILIITLNIDQSLWDIGKFFAKFAKDNNLFDTFSKIHVIFGEKVHLITLRKE